MRRESLESQKVFEQCHRARPSLNHHYHAQTPNRPSSSASPQPIRNLFCCCTHTSVCDELTRDFDSLIQERERETAGGGKNTQVSFMLSMRWWKGKGRLGFVDLVDCIERQTHHPPLHLEIVPSTWSSATLATFGIHIIVNLVFLHFIFFFSLFQFPSFFF